MLATLTKRVKERTAVIDRFLSLCDACDELAANGNGVRDNELAARLTLRGNLTEEKVFRHCATITQLYSIYESFTENLLTFWLTRLPRYQSFLDLPVTFQNAYRYGISRIIKDSNQRKYRNLALTEVLDKYISSLQGEAPWEFVGEALTTHESNLRRTQFEQMFHAVGLEGVWAALERNPSVAHLTIEGDANKSLEQMILDLVIFRNDASHGSPDEILGSDSLRNWIKFIEAFCDALAQFLTHRIVSKEATHKPDAVFGIVTETLRNNIVIATCDRGSLRVGDYYFFLRNTDCAYARIESLQIDNFSYSFVEIGQSGIEVGIKTSTPVQCKAKLIKVDERT